MNDVETHPVQTHYSGRQPSGKISKAVTLAAYEVYRHIHGPQEALITGECRGGFSSGELIAFLYARSFPKNEWRERVEQALCGMEGL